MAKVVASHPYCLENSTQLTRPGSDSFYRIDGSNAPTIIDKHQAKRSYRLQQAPNVNNSLHLDSSDVSYEAQGHFESILQKQINESSIQPATSIYHRPTDMSDVSMARFSFGKARPDPQRLIPSESITVRNHPSAITILRHEQGSNSEVVPSFTDRLVLDRSIRGRLGPGGTLNPEEDCKQAESYFRSQGRLPTQANRSYNPVKRNRSTTDEFNRDELARRFMYTSVQQAAHDEVAWDTKLPPKLPVPTTTFEEYGSDPFNLFKLKSLSSVYDIRSQKVLDWDRVQSRNIHYHRKPFFNVAPLSRAQQISGYSGTIGGDHIQDIDNPSIDFKPSTILRSEQPKFGINSFKTNIPHYTGKTHWTKLEPVSHYDQSGHAYTTTEAFHKPLAYDYSSYRHSGVHGQLSRSVTTVLPQNPFNQIDLISTTVNGSLDSRSRILIQGLPGKKLPPPPPPPPPLTREDNNNGKIEEYIDNNEIKN